MMIRYFFLDMDGTLTEWRSAATAEELHSPGYFRGLAPNEELIKLLSPLLTKDEERFSKARLVFWYKTGIHLSADCEIFILSAVLGSTQKQEKEEWLDKNFPVPEKNRVFVPYGKSKARTVRRKLKRRIDPSFMLLDDHSPNLIEWFESGGKAVKLLNGVNGAGRKWQGERLDPRLEVNYER